MSNSEKIPFSKLRRIYRPDMVFWCGLKRGLPLLEAFRRSHDSRAKATIGDLRDACARLLAKHRDLFGVFLDKSARHEAIALMAEAVVEEQLRSRDSKDRDAGVKHARAICGMDAPTQTHTVIESPHLDREPLDFTPASERFKPQKVEQN
jgi:hypothetical protein